MAEHPDSLEGVTDPLHRLVRLWAQAVNARDPEAIAMYSHPDIDCYPLQIAAVGGHYRGHDGLRRWIEDILTSDIGHNVRFVGIRTLADGRVALFGEVCLEGSVISPYSMIVTVRDGAVTAMRSYLSDEDTMEHLKLLG